MDDLIRQGRLLRDQIQKHYHPGYETLPPDEQITVAELEGWYTGMAAVLEQQYGPQSPELTLWNEGLARVQKESWEEVGKVQARAGYFVQRKLDASLGLLAQIRLLRLRDSGGEATASGGTEDLRMSETCFVLAPFGTPFDGYYKRVLAPSIRAAGLKPMRADEIYRPGAIINDIVENIRSSAALVADVTGKNPNVNYELGLAHAFGRPAVIISQSAADLPFDYGHLRAIIYDTRDDDWARKLKVKITESLKNCGASGQVIGTQSRVDAPRSRLSESTFNEVESHRVDPAVPDKLHHVSLAVRNVERSVAFYRDTLGLEQIDRPGYKFKGAWFRLSDRQYLHLVARLSRRVGIIKDGERVYYRDNHFALRVKDIEKAEADLRSKNIRPRIYRTLVTKFPQLYILDPDGHVVEINQAPDG